MWLRSRSSLPSGPDTVTSLTTALEMDALPLAARVHLGALDADVRVDVAQVALELAERAGHRHLNAARRRERWWSLWASSGTQMFRDNGVSTGMISSVVSADICRVLVRLLVGMSTVLEICFRRSKAPSSVRSPKLRSQSLAAQR